MSVTELKAKATRKASNKTTKAEKDALQAAISAAQTEIVPLSDLVKSPFNVRTIPYSADSVRGLADSIIAIGLLQNLIVHTLPEGKSGVAAGGRRLSAMQLLCEDGRVSADYPVTVKRIPDELAVVASVAENELRVAMHPAEQITSFRTMAEAGKTPAQIGDALGYGSRHVQRMLKLASLAPSLLALLANDELDVEQCQALCLENVQTRQVEIFESVKASYGTTPAHLLKRAVTETEMRLDSPLFCFVGREAYETAGGYVREDLFSQQDGEGTADRVLVERLAQEKLDAIAQDIQQQEGWKWAEGRSARIWHHGEDARVYVLSETPAPVYTRHEQQRLDELYEQHEQYDSVCEESDAIEDEIYALEQTGAINAWTDDVKAVAGVAVSLYQGAVLVQRGIRLVADMPEEEQKEAEPAVYTSRHVDAAEGISVPLLTRMSSERTLAVQAALMQQPSKAVALMAWRLCTTVFCGCLATSHPFRITLTEAHNILTGDAPSGKEGTAYVALMQEKERLAALLPAGWAKDFTTFFSLDGGVLMSLMAFCTACSVDGVQTRDMGHTSRSNLDTLESALDFHLRDWWHPTKENYFSSLKHTQIIEALQDAGKSGAAVDAAKLKKGDAAAMAEDYISDTRWVPAWLKAPKKNVTADVTADDMAADTDNTVAHAA